MALPKHFEFTIRYHAEHEQYSMKLIDGSYYCGDAGVTPNKYSGAKHSVEFVKSTVDEGVWIIVKVIEPAINIPNHFTFNHEHTSQVYDMKRVGDKWLCTLNGKGWDAYYTEEDIKYHIASKTWQNIKAVEDNGNPLVKPLKAMEYIVKVVGEQMKDAMKEVVKEPELVFPFTFTIPNHNEYVYEAKAVGSKVEIFWTHHCGGSSYYNKDEVRKHLKSGEWIVKSVGEQPTEAVSDSVAEECEKLIEWKHCMSYNDSYFGEPEGLLKRVVYQLDRLLSVKSVKAQDNNTVTVAPIEIKVDVPIEHINELTDVIHNLADAYERLARVKGSIYA